MKIPNGKLVVPWVPGSPGAGGSTLAAAVGIGVQHITGKKTCIINFSTNDHMERFLENDIKMTYTMDTLKSFGEDIGAEHILSFSTKVNESLYIIPGSFLGDLLNCSAKKFAALLLDKCLEIFDIVVIDIPHGMSDDNQKYLEQADVVLAVIPGSEIVLSDLADGIYIRDSKTVAVFNKFPEGFDIPKEVDGYIEKYNLSNGYGLVFDGGAYKACCKDKAFYSFLKTSLEKNRTAFSMQLTDICAVTAEKLGFTYSLPKTGKGFFGRLFNLL